MPASYHSSQLLSHTNAAPRRSRAIEVRLRGQIPTPRLAPASLLPPNADIAMLAGRAAPRGNERDRPECALFAPPGGAEVVNHAAAAHGVLQLT
jgi:hypothetical protein